MTLLLFLTVTLGILAGHYVLPAALVPRLGSYAMFVLLFVLVGIGIELGASASLVERLKRLRPQHLLLPVTSALGTLLGTAAGALGLGLGLPLGLSIGSGFGWYSLSSVLLAELLGAEIAALAFLTNVARELIAIPLIPLLVRLRLGFAAITPGGATTMDTTLAVISQVTGEETTLVALYHGVVLSLLVPLLVTFFARMV